MSSQSDSEQSGEYDSDSSSSFEFNENNDTPALDYLWERPSTPPEDFSNAEGANADGHWNVEIIGEEVDDRDRVRYEAKWAGWKRKDGTSTTWDNDLIHPHDLIAWKKRQTHRRNRLANASLSIIPWSTNDVHNIKTRLRAQAHHEKLEKLKEIKRRKIEQGLPTSEMEEKEILDKKYWEAVAKEGKNDNSEASTSSRPTKRLRETSPEFNMPAAPSSRRSTTIASSSRSPSIVSLPPRVKDREIRATSTLSRSRTATISSASASSSAADRYITPPYSSTSASSISKGKGKGKRIMPEPPSPQYRPITPSRSPSIRPQKSLPNRTKATTKKSRRTQLAEQWSKIAKKENAEPITFVNEEDDEEIPQLPPDFEYIESGYIYSADVDDYSKMAEAFVHCDCDHCENPAKCGCQDPSDLVDDNGNRYFAYEDGLFAFKVPNGYEVIECNQYCQCDPASCPNRVAQQPRDFPLEIFKTKDRGWGVRSSYDIPRGKVLGTYAGLLLKRDTDLQSSYCFDLDGNEDLDGEAGENAYTVDSLSIGNWTRFINHSCTPNLSVYSVVYDTIPTINQPYHAYYALEDIPAGTEFTFDYDPKAAELIQAHANSKKKGKKKAVRPAGARDCMCGSSGCRGWVRV